MTPFHFCLYTNNQILLQKIIEYCSKNKYRILYHYFELINYILIVKIKIKNHITKKYEINK